MKKMHENRNTIGFLCIWEQINNPGFKPVEFDGFKKQAALNLSNLENLNALFISQGQPQSERLIQLNQIAIQQMKILTASENAPMLPAQEVER